MQKYPDPVATSLRLVVLFALLFGMLPTVTFTVASAAPAPAPAAQVATTNDLTLQVVSARTEPNAPNGPVVKGDEVSEYKYLINVDNTGDPSDDTGCTSTDAGYPDSCDWPSLRELPGSAPIYTQGDQSDFAGGGSLTLPDGKYLITVMADGYKLDGLHFTLPRPDTGPLIVQVQPHPLPAATMRIKVFEDISPVNGQFDAPAEQGLAGFLLVINDIAGQVSTDVFGNPLCTTYDADMNVTGQTDCLHSDANGDIAVPNLGPNRFDVVVIPPDGTNWTETTTLEGSPSWDTWLMEGGTGLDNEFVVAGEPFPWTIFGFVRPQDDLNNSFYTGGVKGTIVSASVYSPQQGALPYFGNIWTGFSGTKVNGPVEDAWVALTGLQVGDTALYIGQANPDGTFQIDNVPDGNYQLTWWDTNLNYILDWIQVTVSNGEIYDMGTPFLTGWFTKVEGYVFNDTNKNGVKDPGEAGIGGYPVVLRDRDNSEIDRMSILVVTDPTGYYVLEKAYPMGSWMVLEAYNDRYYTTGVTYQVENQPTPTTVLGNGVDVGVLPILGQAGRLDWGVHSYEAGTNGGIVGTVFYDTTRNELDPRFAAVEGWAPGIPGLTVNLYSLVDCGTTGAPCDDATGWYELNPDGSYAKGNLLNTTETEIWQQPTDCIARDANGVELTNPEDQQLLPPDPTGKRCIEAPLSGTQFQSDFATLDGNYGFGDGCFDNGVAGVFDPGTGDCSAGVLEPLPANDYLVEVVIPEDDRGRPLYKVEREEDINVFGGDQFAPAVPPPACAGALHTVDVAGAGTDGYPETVLPNGVTVSASTPTINPSFVDAGDIAYEGLHRPLCDIKLVTLDNGKSIAPLFTLFTDVPIPGKWKGYIIDDLTISTDPTSLNYGEKAGIPNSPIGIYDFTNRLITTIQSDPNGVFEVLLPSTYSINCPTPSGVCPNVYYMLGNDPGQPEQANPNYNPQYRTIGASFEIYPGLVIPSDLAPTQIVPGVLAAGSLFGTPPQCTLDVATPQIFRVSQPFAVIQGTTIQDTFTIQGIGFGAQGLDSQVTLGGVHPLQINTWTDTDISVTVPSGTPVGPLQLAVTTDSGLTTVNGLTFHVIGVGYRPRRYEVPSGLYPTIQSALDRAAQPDRADEDSLIIVYPDAPVQWNPAGAYFENLIVYNNVKLQGVGPGGVYTNGTTVLGSVIDGRGIAGDTAYATAWRDQITAIPWDGNQAIYEGAVVTVVAEDGEFSQSYKTAIDGFRIQGGDQQGFAANLTPTDPATRNFAAVQGGGIFANAYARYLQITNNIMESNGGSYGAAVRIGTPHLSAPYDDGHNDNIRIANNRILANGGTNLAGAVGLFSGSTGYEVAYNDICGNFSAEYGGGISHYGYSPDGKIHHNRIYFNRSYDEGGGIMIAGELPADPAILSPGAGPVNIYNNLIQANLANDDGGGLRFLMAGDFPYNVYNNIIVNNVSTHEGGGVALNDTPDVRFINNTVMKNITTATAVTSNGFPAPAGFSTSLNSNLLQATLALDAPLFSNPKMFNNIFWDNRAGTFTGGTVAGIGLTGDPNPVNYWDVGTADNSGLLEPTSSILQVATGTTGDASNISSDPLVVQTYDTSVSVQPWRGNPRFVDILMVTTDATPNLLGDYHITSGSPAAAAGVGSAVVQGTTLNVPLVDIDDEIRGADMDYEIGADEIPTVGNSFPANAVLDDFNRPNGGVNTLGTWGGQIGRFRIRTNVAQVRGDISTMQWDTPFGANQEAYFTFNQIGSTAVEQGFVLKLSNGTNARQNSATFIQVAYSDANDEVIVYTHTPSHWVDQAHFPGITFQVGDQFGARAFDDGTVSIYRNGNLLGYTNVTTTADPWPTGLAAAGGQIGVYFIMGSNWQGRLDDFGGGDVPPALALNMARSWSTLIKPVFVDETAINPLKEVYDERTTGSDYEDYVEEAEVTMDQTLFLPFVIEQ
ncbi:MAG: SdrD B-like domain-containing protein [Caldilineaceae bacterium]